MPDTEKKEISNSKETEDDNYWFPEIVQYQREQRQNMEASMELKSGPLSESKEGLVMKRWPDTPPPEYATVSNSRSMSLVPQFQIMTKDEDLKTSITHYVDQIWDTWKITGNISVLPNPEEAITKKPEISANEDPKAQLVHTDNLEAEATECLESLTKDMIEELVAEVLQVQNPSKKSFVDTLRCGPLGLLAKRAKLPKTKEQLINSVLSEMLAQLPSNMVDRSIAGIQPSHSYSKRCARPSDIVDDVLMEEMIRDEVQWSEFWPEEALVKMRTCDKVIHSMVKDVLRFYEIVHLQ